MFKSILHDRKLLILLVLALLIKLFSLKEAWVEKGYTYGLYQPISRVLRFSLGWLPFSLGDILYFVAFFWLVAKTWKFLSLLARRQVKTYLSWILFRKYLRLMVGVYIIFNLFWGLNYNRQGIASQLALNVEPYNKEDLYQLSLVLQQRLCQEGEKVDSIKRLRFRNKKQLFDESVKQFKKAAVAFPYFSYPYPSIKPSLLTPFGHYFGFTGYYNPFSGEAQLKTTIPNFLKPFVTCHEIAHQLGYAKENEANMVSFLVGRQSPDTDFRYSVYWEMYAYTIRQLYRHDRERGWLLMQTVHPRYKIDYEVYYNYIMEGTNKVEPLVTRFYDNFLKMNNQPKGTMTYNEVTAWLIAYMKKYGAEAI